MSEAAPARKNLWSFALLWLVLTISALAVVYSTHRSRQLFHELETLKDQQYELDVEWGQLLLEQSAWAAPVRVEKMAANKLRMTLPQPEQTEMVKP
jgi:cell division protein FtsL